jgi:hypothetical protein
MNYEKTECPEYGILTIPLEEAKPKPLELRERVDDVATVRCDR